VTGKAPGRIVFTEAAVKAHIARHHPLCPEEVRQALVARIIDRDWRDVSLGRAFGIVSNAYVRHQLTDYERLLKVHGLNREEARLIIQAEVADAIATWGGAARCLTPDRAHPPAGQAQSQEKPPPQGGRGARGTEPVGGG